MKVLVCGSRSWSDARPIYERLQKLPVGTTFIVGGAAGPDTIAEVFARCHEEEVKLFLPDWKAHGKRAGFLRNLQMLDEKPDLVLAFWDGESKGTKHTIDEAYRRGITVEVVL